MRIHELPDATERQAQVVATYGRRFRIRLPSGERAGARVKGRRLKPVCGDRVSATTIDGDRDWLITAILPRENTLERPDSRGRTEVLAANLSLIVVVAAEVPKPDWFLIDRYLAAARMMGVRAAIVLNKADLSVRSGETDAAGDYESLGYPVVRASAVTGAGLAELERLLSGETAIFAGQSGVGKSSLVNRLLAQAERRTAGLSARSGAGRHTTVNSVLVELPQGGAVIDSPGVRDYAPAIGSPDRVAAGFIEIAALAQDCRYANCRHLQEPQCAVKAAVDSGRISPRRYESYRRLVELTGKFADRY